MISMAETVSLRSITEHNYDQVCKLSTKEGQPISAGPARHLVKAQFRFHWTRAIYAGEIPVGCLIVNMELEDEYPWLNLLLIDKAHQGKGYGKAAVQLLFNNLKPYVKFLHVCTPNGNGPRMFYEKLGFEIVPDRRMGDLLDQIVLKKTF